jgi:hypothetical protein
MTMLPKSTQESDKLDPPELPKLPEEVWLNIFKFLDYVSLIKVSNISTQFYSISKTSWKNRLSTFENIKHQEVTLDNAVSIFKNLKYLELFIAVQSNNIEKVKLMLKENRRFAQTELTLRDHDGSHTNFYPLFYACDNRYFELAILLLENGAPANILIQHQGNLIHFVLNKLINNNINLLGDQAEKLVSLLLSNTVDKIIDSTDNNANTAFYLFMKYLTWNHENAEEIACAIRMIKLFLDHGADPTVKCTHKESVLDLAVCKIDPYKIPNPDPALKLIRECILSRITKDEQRISSIIRLAECGILDVDCDLSSYPTDKLTDIAERVEKINCAVTTGRGRGGYFIKRDTFISAKDFYYKNLHAYHTDDKSFDRRSNYGKYSTSVTRVIVEHAAKAVGDAHLLAFLESLNALKHEQVLDKRPGKK